MDDLARFHATAVRDFGDPALAEVADFRDQLHKANPRAAQSWLSAMKKELPAETDLMEQVLKQVEKEDADVKEIDLDQPRQGKSDYTRPGLRSRERQRSWFRLTVSASNPNRRANNHRLIAFYL